MCGGRQFQTVLQTTHTSVTRGAGGRSLALLTTGVGGGGILLLSTDDRLDFGLNNLCNFWIFDLWTTSYVVNVKAHAQRLLCSRTARKGCIFLCSLECHQWVSEQMLNGTSAPLDHTVPFKSVHAGKYGTEDKSKTDITKTTHNPEKANNTKHSNKN